MKLCKDCKHARRDWLFGMRFAKCRAIPDGVTGTPKWHCSTERNSVFDAVNQCGSKGVLWEQRGPSLVKRLINWLRGILL